VSFRDLSAGFPAKLSALFRHDRGSVILVSRVVHVGLMASPGLDAFLAFVRRLAIGVFVLVLFTKPSGPAAAGILTFTNYTTSSGLGGNSVYGVYADGSTVYAATAGGLSIATIAAVPEIDPVTGGSALSLVAGVLAMIEQRRRRAALVA
jgi:hypothetical protein